MGKATAVMLDASAVAGTFLSISVIPVTAYHFPNSPALLLLVDGRLAECAKHCRTVEYLCARVEPV
jgi:hypothetical protein